MDTEQTTIQNLGSLLAKKDQENSFLLKILEDIHEHDNPIKLVKYLRTFLEQYYNVIIEEFLHYSDNSIKSYINQEKQFHSTSLDALLDEIKATEFHVIANNEQPIAIVSWKNTCQSDVAAEITEKLSRIVAIAIENQRLLKVHIEENRYENEIKIARKVQNMLITKDYPFAEEIEIDTIYIPHREVSGDYYDFLKIGEKKVVFCIADVSGKGVPAALLMAAFQATFRRLSANFYSLKDLVTKMNSAVFNNTRGERFVSAFFGEYDLSANILTFINAGHNYPRLTKEGDLQYLIKGCTLLGIIPAIENLQEGSVAIDSDTLLFLYTDGLAEIKINDQEIFESHELDHFISKNNQLSPKSFNAKLKERILGYNDKIKDDITVFTCKIKPERIV